MPECGKSMYFSGIVDTREHVDPAVLDIAADRDWNDPSYFIRRTHGSSSWLLILTLGGQGRVACPGKEAVVNEGDIVLFAPKTLQEYGTAPGASEWEILWAHFHLRPHWLPILDWPPVGPGLSKIRLGGESARLEVQRELESAVEASRRGTRFSTPIAMAHLELALLLCRDQADQSRPLDPRLQVAMDATRDLRLPWDIPTMARLAGLSASQFTRLFREETGSTPRDWLESRRMDLARQLLTMSDLTLRAIASRIGFESEFYFSRRFRQATGLSPSEYRAKHRSSAGQVGV